MPVNVFDHFEKNVITLFDAEPAGGSGLVLPSETWRWWCEPQNIGIWVLCGGANVNLKIDLEGSIDDIAANYAILEGASPILTVSDNLPHVLNMLAISMPRLRLMVTDNPGNGADTVLTVKIFQPFRLQP